MILTREQVEALVELHELRRQIDNAIAVVQTSKMKPMTCAELAKFTWEFPPGSFFVGDFVIKRRAPHETDPSPSR